MKIKGPHTLALGVCAAAVAWMLSGYFAPSKHRNIIPVTPTTNTVLPRTVRVRVSVAERRDNIVHLFGQTQASRRVALRAEIDGHIAEVTVERGAAITAGAVIARLAVDDRNVRLVEARALLAQYQAELNATRTLAGKGSRAELDVAAARTHFETAQALVTRMELDLACTVLHAPFAGVVETRAIELGSFLQVGDPVATIIDLNPLRIVGYISEREVIKVSVGQAAQARLMDGRIVAGTIAYIATVADPTTRTFRVELEIANAQDSHGQIIEGLTAELMIPIGSVIAHSVSPALLSLADDGRLGIKIVNEADIVEFVPVRIVATTPSAMWVDGPPARATLIVVGQDFVNPGQRVRTVIENSAPKLGTDKI